MTQETYAIIGINLRNDNLIFAKYLVIIELYKEVYDLKQKNGFLVLCFILFLSSQVANYDILSNVVICCGLFAINCDTGIIASRYNRHLRYNDCKAPCKH